MVILHFIILGFVFTTFEHTCLSNEDLKRTRRWRSMHNQREHAGTVVRGSTGMSRKR
jgi:hypothetical protein